MTLLRSETQIHADLRIITHTLWIAHRGRSAPLIHVTKEIACLLLDHKPMRNTLLTRRYTIHGVEAGIEPNDIFGSFMPLGKALANYARSFNLFMMVEKANQTTVIPLGDGPPDLLEFVADPKIFTEEAEFLGPLGFIEKNILATHRNKGMTSESHQVVAQLFLRYNSKLLENLRSRKPKIAIVETLVNKMNECADELVKKSTFYPSQATLLKEKLSKNKNTIAESFAERIIPHEEFSTEIASVSGAILRGSHLVRSLLWRKGFYPHKSSPVHIQIDRFVNACKSAGLDTYKVASNFSDVKAVMHFLRDTVNSRLIWWR